MKAQYLAIALLSSVAIAAAAMPTTTRASVVSLTPDPPSGFDLLGPYIGDTNVTIPSFGAFVGPVDVLHATISNITGQGNAFIGVGAGLTLDLFAPATSLSFTEGTPSQTTTLEVLFGNNVDGDFVSNSPDFSISGTVPEEVNISGLAPFDAVMFFDKGNPTLSELSFRAAAGTPEPSTWAMMLLGFAGVAYAGWKRRRANRLSVFN
jgi:hypothetical protein